MESFSFKSICVGHCRLRWGGVDMTMAKTRRKKRAHVYDKVYPFRVPEVAPEAEHQLG